MSWESHSVWRISASTNGWLDPEACGWMSRTCFVSRCTSIVLVFARRAKRQSSNPPQASNEHWDFAKFAVIRLHDANSNWSWQPLSNTSTYLLVRGMNRDDFGVRLPGLLCSHVVILSAYVLHDEVNQTRLARSVRHLSRKLFYLSNRSTWLSTPPMLLVALRGTLLGQFHERPKHEILSNEYFLWEDKQYILSIFLVLRVSWQWHAHIPRVHPKNILPTAEIFQIMLHYRPLGLRYQINVAHI